MSYVKTQWVNNTTPINDTNLNKIEQGIYDNSLVTEAIADKLNPTDTETYKTAELTEGQITDVIGVSDILIKGQTSQDGEPTPSSPVDVNVVSGSNVINTSNKNLFNYNKWFAHKTDFDNSFFEITKENIISIIPTKLDTDTLTPPMSTKPSKNDIKALKWMSFSVEPNKDYTIIVKNENSCRMQILRFLYKKNYSFIDVQQSSMSNGQYHIYSFKTTDDTKFVSFRFDNESYNAEAKILKINEIQLLKGIYTSSNRPSYDSHQGKELPLDLPVENLFDGIIENGGLESKGLNADNAKRVRSKNYTSVSHNQTYTISIPEYNANKGTVQTGISFYTNNDYSTARISESEWKTVPYTFTTPQNCNFIRFIVKIHASSGDSDVIYTDINKVQIEQGSKANAYTPYGTDPIELCKIGNYQDYFYKSGSKWYLKKYFKKKIFVGASDEGWARSENGKFNNLSETDYMPNNQGAVWINTHFKTLSNQDNSMWIGNAGFLNCWYSNANTVGDFTTWLASNNVTLYYLLKTATDTEITDTTLISQLEAIYNAPLYEETNITQTNNDLPMVLDITACKDNINGIKAFIRK